MNFENVWSELEYDKEIDDDLNDEEFVDEDLVEEATSSSRNPSLYEKLPVFSDVRSRATGELELLFIFL